MAVKSTVVSPRTPAPSGHAPVAFPVDSAGARRQTHKPSRTWRLLRLLIASSKDHAFLDRPWVPWLFRVCPPGRRRGLALYLLSLSPHYWIYQWTTKYPAHVLRAEVLEREYRRNAESRRQLCELLLKQFLRPEMTALDFGCGPGFLASAASEHVAHLMASDVSRGVIACARELNPAPRLTYVTNGISDLRNLANASIDLVYSFAVFQHLRKTQTQAFLNEFARVLKPGGQGICHTILKDADQAGEYGPKGRIEKRVMLRMVYYAGNEWRQMLAKAGLEGVQIRNVSDCAEIDDDIGKEQLVTFRRNASI